MRFASNNTRMVVQAGDKLEAENRKKDPILLIVFDISGSMDEVLPNE